MSLSRIFGILAASCVLTPSASWATTVLKTSLPDLVRMSQVVVRAHVSWVDDRAGETAGKFQTRFGFEVDETVKGLEAGTTMLELQFPGGKVGQYTMRVSGTPSFAPGDEVVLLVERTAGGDALAGLAQGVFKVERKSGSVRIRSIDGNTRIVDERGRETLAARVDLPLDDFMTELRTLAVDGAR